MGISIVFGSYENIWIIYKYLLAFFQKFVPQIAIFFILGKIRNISFTENWIFFSSLDVIE